MSAPLPMAALCILSVAPVHDLAQALDNPWQSAMGMIASVDRPARAAMRVPANPIRVDGARLPGQAAPSLGADTDALLAEVGIDAAEIARLRTAEIA